MRPGRLVLVGVIGAALVAGGWAGARLFLPVENRSVLEACLLALLGLLAGAGGCVATCLAHRRQMGRLADLVRAQREYPGPGTLVLARRSLDSSDAEALWEQFEALTDSYRAALAEVVQM